MLIKNSSNQYGFISKLLHWVIALLVLTQFYLVYWKEWMLAKDSPLAHFYINNLHKPIGILVLMLAILALGWKISNPKPGYPTTMPMFEKKSAFLVQWLLYITLFIMPISGVLMSTAAGYPPSFFGLFEIPQFMAKNEGFAQLCFDVHAVAGYLLMALVSIHILAALKHHFINHDNVLKRML